MIYIIDDDLSIRDGFTMLLKSAKYKCRSFESAEEFLESYEEGEDDLLILDIHLPGMSGSSLMKYLRKNNKHPFVIIITAYDEQSTRSEAKKYGAIAYLRKPVDGTALIDVIRYRSESFMPNNNNL